MRTDVFALVLCAAMAGTAPSAAATFWVRLAPEESVNLDAVQFDKAPETLPDDPGGFELDLPPGTVTARLSVLVVEPPLGSATFRMAVNVPYFWGSDRDRDVVAVAIIPLSLTDDDIDRARNEGEAMLKTSRAQQVLLNRLTRMAFNVLRPESHWPNPEDVKITSLFVRSSNQLVTTGYVEPDEDMRRAEVELDGLLLDHPDLFESEKARQDARLAIDEFGKFRRTQFEGIVNQVSDDVGSEPSPEACARARSVFDMLKTLPEATRAQLDPGRSFEVLNLGAMAQCISPSVSLSNSMAEPERNAAIEFALKVIQQINLATSLYRTTADVNQTRLQHALEGRDNIKAQIDYFRPLPG